MWQVTEYFNNRKEGPKEARNKSSAKPEEDMCPAAWEEWPQPTHDGRHTPPGVARQRPRCWAAGGRQRRRT